MASSKELKALITLAGKIDPSLQSSMMKASKMSQKVSQDTKKSASMLSKVSTIAKGVFVGNLAYGAVTKLAYGMIEAGKSGVKLASDLTEVQNVVDVTFGQSTNKINDWAKTALDSFGLSELQAKQFSGTLGAMMKSSGVSSKYLVDMSEKLTGLSGDFASFYNLKPEEAFEKIRSGISGETEPLKALGINMSVANLEAYALKKGITQSYQEMDQAAQTALRYSYLMSVSKDAQGDFARTQDTFANQVRLLKVNFEQLSAKVMSKAIPGLTKVAQVANNFIKNISSGKMSAISSKVIEPFKRIYDVGSRVFKSISKTIEDNQPLLNNLGSTAMDLVDKLSKGFEAAEPTIEWLFKTGVPAVTGTITDLIKGATDLYNFINDHWKDMEPIVMGIAAAVAVYEANLIRLTVAEKAGLIIEVLNQAWAYGQLVLFNLQNGMKLATVAQLLFNTAMEANPIGVVITLIGLAVAAGVALYQNWDTISASLSKTWEAIKKAFDEGVKWCTKKIDNLIEKFNKLTGLKIPTLTEQNDKEASKSDSDKIYDRMSKHALGGIATKPAIFGEAGPEMAIPLNRSPRSFELLRRTTQILGVQNKGYKPGSLSSLNVERANTYTPGSLSEINGSQMIQSQQSFKMPDVNVKVIINESKSSKEDIDARIKEAVKSAIEEVMEAFLSGKERVEYG